MRTDCGSLLWITVDFSRLNQILEQSFPNLSEQVSSIQPTSINRCLILFTVRGVLESIPPVIG